MTAYKIINRRKRFLTAVADAVLRPLGWLLGTSRPGAPPDPAAVRNILVIRTAYAGDVVMTLPLLPALRDRFPAARITLLTSRDGAELAQGQPALDRLLAFDAPWFYGRASWKPYPALLRTLRAERYDLVIEARGDIRDILLLTLPLRAAARVSYAFGGGAWALSHVVPYHGIKHRVDYHLDIARHLGCTIRDPYPRLALSETEHTEARRLLAQQGLANRFIAWHPGGRLDLKRWPLERHAELMKEVHARTRWPVALLASPAEAELAARLQTLAAGVPITSLSGHLSLRQLAAVLAEAALLVCHDSAPMHVAAAVGTPVAALFGPSKPEETAPYAFGPAAVLARPMPCRTTCDEIHCLAPDHHACMRQLSVAQALESLTPLLAQDGIAPVSNV